MTHVRSGLLFIALASLSAGVVIGSAHAQGAAGLRAAYESRSQALSTSPFKRPLLLEAKVADAASKGDVHAVIDHGFAAVSTALRDGARWCEVFMLQTNVKRCVAAGEGDAQTLKVSIVRRHDQPVSQAYEVTFRFRRVAAGNDHLAVSLSADSGPLGTSDYRLGLEAVPLDAKRSIVHMSYAYTTGAAARMATQAYLATSGRDKVGFTVTGRDASGAPTYAGGIQGVAERNTMRYFLAIESLLETMDTPVAQRTEARLRDFHAALEKYPRQLRELSADEYLAMKRRETQAP